MRSWFEVLLGNEKEKEAVLFTVGRQLRSDGRMMKMKPLINTQRSEP